MNIKQKLQALISAANETTGETATDVTEAVQALVDGYGGGGSVDAAFIKKTQNYNYTSGSLTKFYLFSSSDLISAGILTESTRNIKDLWQTCVLMVYAANANGSPAENVTTPNKVLNLMMQYPCATYNDAGGCYCGNLEYRIPTGTLHTSNRQSGEWINVNNGDLAWIDANGNVNLKTDYNYGYLGYYTAYLICTGRKTAT